MERFRQKRKKNLPGIRLNHGCLVANIGRIIHRTDGQDMTLGLKGAAQLARPLRRAARDDHGFNARIREHLFQVADARRLEAPTLEVFQPRPRPAIQGQLMTAGSCQGPGHVQAVGMISEKGKTH